MASAVIQLQEFLGGFDLPEPIIKLALKKCNLKVEEAIIMITDEDQVNDLQEEFRKQEEQKQEMAILIEDD